MALQTSESQTWVKFSRLQQAAQLKINERWDRNEVIECTLKELEALTQNFKEENLIGVTTYGKAYRGKIKLDSTGSQTRDVTVKIWDNKVLQIDDGEVMSEEVDFLTRRGPGDSGYLVKLIAICNEAQDDMVNGVVYDLNPLDSLYNHTPKDNFCWMKRINVALVFAKFLRCMHEGIDYEWPHVVSNIDSTNIILDQEYNPILIDFGLVSGGLMGGPRYAQYFGTMPLGYRDPYHDGYRPEMMNDVYAYGMILLGLIAKRVDKKEDFFKEGYETMEQWARRVYNPSSSSSSSSSSSCNDCSSLVHPSLKEDEYYDESDGMALTELVMKCIQVGKPYERPCMYHVINCLEELCAFRASSSQGAEDALTDERVKVVCHCAMLEFFN